MSRRTAPMKGWKRIHMAMKSKSPSMLALMRGIVVALQLVLLTTLAACGGVGASGEPDAVGGPAVMRRLTESEFRATLAVIFVNWKDTRLNPSHNCATRMLSFS